MTDADSEFTPIPLYPEETKIPTSQATKQGYLTSILSSLPNLSLSSITGDASGAQAVENVTDLQNTNPYVPSYDHHDTLRDSSPPLVANFHDPRRVNFEVNPGSTGSLQAPPQASVPPSIPTSTNGEFLEYSSALEFPMYGL